MPCPGDSAEFCGGSYSMNVSENPDADFVRSYRGRYSDPPNNRVFVQSDSSDAMTSEESVTCPARATPTKPVGGPTAWTPTRMTPRTLGASETPPTDFWSGYMFVQRRIIRR
ncbi:unnamed protein product [Ectocarpus sp. 4 AP-2014]